MSTVTAPQNPVEQLVTDLAGPARLFALDIENMSDEMLGACPGGKARCGYDLVFEVAQFHRFVAQRAAGNEATLDLNGWPQAPQPYQEQGARP